NEEHTVIIPIENSHFSEQIPLNYGEGVHKVHLHLEGEKDDLFYESATLYVDNQSDKELPEFNEYAAYVDSGVTLETPSQDMDTDLDEIEYPIIGKIDGDAPRADDITHVIVDVEQMEEQDKATYFIPV